MSELVSIITPSYNSAAYIAEMIESILAQTYTNWELLITDDCSTDDSVKIIESYATKDSRIKLFRLASNSGAGIARNKSIEEARGRYIAFCDSDDLWKPQKLEKQVEFMQKSTKANGYQALHVTLMSNKGQWIEVQIRSERMNDVAEQGFAAHWKYKEGGGSEDEGELSKWLKTIKEILDDPQPDALDFLDTIKLNLFASEIFVFTPKGEIKTMPQNATALDFAFSIHTFLGSHCIGAKVNHKLVPLSHKLQSGDQVEILTSKSQKVQPSWINFATTAKAKAKILSILKRERKEVQQAGEDMLHEFLKKEGIEATETNIQKLCTLHKLKTPEDLMYQIGQKVFILGDLEKNELKEKSTPTNWKKYIAFAFGGGSKPKSQDNASSKERPALNIDKKKIVKLTPEEIQKHYIIADCCKPIPGDDVLGYIDDNNRIIIHKRQCPIATQLKTSFGNRLLAVQWETGKALNFPVNVYMKGIDGIGVLNQVTGIISQQLNVNIHKLNIESSDGIFEGRIQLFVHDVDDVNTICENLKKLDHIKKVTRIENFDDTITD